MPIRFFHRGRIVEAAESPPTRTLLDWLREDAHHCGTKEGCNEGDCGACTIVVGTLDDSAQDGLRLESTNACMRFVPTMHGKALFTVEDLKALGGGELHPVQQAMVECHGSQCGFCTPGFVMSLWSVYERCSALQAARPTRQALADALSGNLCRCTGYRPILDAGERMFDAPALRLDRAAVVDVLKGIAPHEADAGAAFHAPRELDALATLVERHPQARLLAGGTDIAVWVNKQFRPLGDVIYVGDVPELQHIEERDDALHIGAAASLESAWQALAQRAPTLAEMWLRFASPPIRHAGTMGGNVANGSPIGDSVPVLMALDATLLLRRGGHTRRMPLDAFYIDYMRNHLQPGEFVQAITVPLAAFDRTLRAYKISKRFDSDISAVAGAFAIALDGEVVREARFAFGGMAAIVKRAAGAEAAVVGQRWSQETVAAAQAALAQEFTPLTDMRASAAYRLQAAQNLLQRFWLETRRGDALPAAQTSVWQPLTVAALMP